MTIRRLVDLARNHDEYIIVPEDEWYAWYKNIHTSSMITGQAGKENQGIILLTLPDNQGELEFNWYDQDSPIGYISVYATIN